MQGVIMETLQNDKGTYHYRITGYSPVLKLEIRNKNDSAP